MKFLGAALLLALLAAPAAAQVTITQAKATAGNVTPGDAAGFPVTLTQPGSYVLKGNLTVPSGKDGIEIKSHDVSIDFNGFRLHGFSVARNGIVTSGSQADTATIKNGIIAGFTGYGINGAGRAFWTVQDMKILVNGGTGVALGNAGQVQRDTIAFSGSVGILASSGSTLLGNAIDSNVGVGIQATGTGPVGVGDTTLFGNNGGGPQVNGVFPLHPNACSPPPC